MPALWRTRRPPGGTGLLLVPAAAFCVHQLRYWLAYGPTATAELHRQGHSYLHSLVPWTILALGIGATLFLRRVAHAFMTGETGRLGRRSTLTLWALTTVGLLAIYTTQETLESYLASGHPGGVAGVLGHGGYWALPAAAVVALVVAAVLRVGEAIVVAAQRLRPRVVPPLADRGRCPAGVLLVSPRPLARAAAGRAPPLVLSV